MKGRVIKVPRTREVKMDKGSSRLYIHCTRDAHMTSEAKGNLAEKRKQFQTTHALKSLNACPPADINLSALQQPFKTPSPGFQTHQSTFEPSFDDHPTSFYDNNYPQSAFNPSLSASTSHYHNGDNPSLSASTSHYHNGDNPSLSASTSYYHNGGKHPIHSSSSSNASLSSAYNPNLSDQRQCHAPLPSPVSIMRNPSIGSRMGSNNSCIIIVYF